MGSNINHLRERIRRVVKRFKRSDMSARFDTSDVIQEVQIQVWQQGHRDSQNIQPIGSALLSAMAKGHLSKLHRLHNAHKRSITQEVASSGPLKSAELGPDEKVEFKELTAYILESIDRLAPESRSVLYARFFLGKTLAQVAEHTGLTVHQVRSRYKSGLKEIKQLLPACEA